MRKISLSLLLALSFLIAHKGFAAGLDGIFPLAEVAGAGAGGGGTVSAGSEARALSTGPDDERMEELRTKAKQLIALRDSVASRYLENLLTVPHPVKHCLGFLPLKLWRKCFDERPGKKMVFDGKRYDALVPTFQGFSLMTNEGVDGYIIEAKRIRDRDMSHLPTLPESESGILRRKTDAHTTLVLGCGRGGGFCGVCLNHLGAVNPKHYTVDKDVMRNPELVGSFLDQRVWNTLGKNSFDEIIMEGVSPYRDIRVARAAFQALCPGGVLRVMHIQPTIFFDTDLKPSVDVPLFASFQNFTGESLLDLSLRDYLTQIIGFERVETYTPETLDMRKKDESQWRAFKAKAPVS